MSSHDEYSIAKYIYTRDECEMHQEATHVTSMHAKEAMTTLAGWQIEKTDKKQAS